MMPLAMILMPPCYATLYIRYARCAARFLAMPQKKRAAMMLMRAAPLICT